MNCHELQQYLAVTQLPALKRQPSMKKVRYPPKYSPQIRCLYCDRNFLRIGNRFSKDTQINFSLILNTRCMARCLMLEFIHEFDFEITSYDMIGSIFKVNKFL